MRQIDPVHRLRLVNAWVLTRYRDIEAVLRDHRRFGNAGRILVETIPLSLLYIDPPEHTRIRALVSKACSCDRTTTAVCYAPVWLCSTAVSSATSVLLTTARSKPPDRVNPCYRFTAFGIGTHPNGVEAAYMRFDLFERRWEFMEVWSDYLVNRLDG